MDGSFFGEGGLSSQNNKYEAKKKALAEIRQNGWKNKKKLKEYFDQYYNNTFYLTSDFCKLWKRCSYKVDLLQEKIEKPEKSKLKDFCYSLNDATRYHSVQNITTLGKMFHDNIPEDLTKKMKNNENYSNTLRADAARVSAEPFQSLMTKILDVYITQSESGINLPYTQGYALLIAVLCCKGVLDIDKDGWGDLIMPSLQKLNDDEYKQLNETIEGNDKQIKKNKKKGWLLEYYKYNHKALGVDDYAGTLDLLRDDFSLAVKLWTMSWYKKPVLWTIGSKSFKKLMEIENLSLYWGTILKYILDLRA